MEIKISENRVRNKVEVKDIWLKINGEEIRREREERGNRLEIK